MSIPPFYPVLPSRFRPLALEALNRPASPFSELPNPLVVVDPFRQRLGFLKDGLLRAMFTISTAANGLGCEENSFRTPVGWHRIHARIGEGAAPGTVFRNRVPTGEVWDGAPLDEDLILTRVLTFAGLEPGINRGPGAILDRTIYLHGTNQKPCWGNRFPMVASAWGIGCTDLFDLRGKACGGGGGEGPAGWLGSGPPAFRRRGGERHESLASSGDEGRPGER